MLFRLFTLLYCRVRSGIEINTCTGSHRLRGGDVRVSHRFERICDKIFQRFPRAFQPTYVRFLLLEFGIKVIHRRLLQQRRCFRGFPLALERDYLVYHAAVEQNSLVGQLLKRLQRIAFQARQQRHEIVGALPDFLHSRAKAGDLLQHITAETRRHGCRNRLYGAI